LRGGTYTVYRGHTAPREVSLKTSIYLPDDLAAQVRAYGISISEVTQTALRQAVHTATIKDSIMTDINAVAERLRGTIDQGDQDKRGEGHRDGIEWAKSYATAEELEHLASLAYTTIRFDQPHTVVDFVSVRQSENFNTVQVDTEEAYWDGFIAGAGEVWEAVRLLLR
jgi:hypothetical protein